MTTSVVTCVPVVAVSYTGTGIYRQQLAVQELVLAKWQLAIRELVLKNLRPKKKGDPKVSLEMLLRYLAFPFITSKAFAAYLQDALAISKVCVNELIIDC